MDRNRKPYKKRSDFEINGIIEQGLATPKDIVGKLLQESYGEITNYYKSINKATQLRRVHDILLKIAKNVALARSSDYSLFTKQGTDNQDYLVFHGETVGEDENSKSTDEQMIFNLQASNNQIAIREQETDIEPQEERESKLVTPRSTTSKNTTAVETNLSDEIIEPGSHRVRSADLEDTQNFRSSTTQWASNGTTTPTTTTPASNISSVPKQKTNKIPKSDRPLTVNDISNQEEESVVHAATKKRKAISASARANTLLSRIENVLDPFERYARQNIVPYINLVDDEE
ncbi:unnamed protein product [Didymodactylos carnosus]|uniref:Uncharacterized protein n=2 Tax=Didymodactylos carnosus TaxID=1234261 RepID=A0A813VLS4_9BILA|nr:unnamed protein product [Didymodactylos carnosus]CAF3626618.1 unnamed protein product [Didymodactylos carnosus]